MKGLRERMTSSIFIQIDNPNLNIIKDNEALNRVISSSPSLALANKITRIIPNEIQANCTIKEGSLGKILYRILASHTLNW